MADDVLPYNTDELKLFYDTIFSEVGKEPQYAATLDDDIKGIANVMKNRLSKPGRFGANMYNVLLAPMQFSGVGSPEFTKAKTGNMNDEEQKIYKRIIALGSSVLRGDIPDITGGADHYYNPERTRITPSWAKQYPMTYETKAHRYYKEVIQPQVKALKSQKGGRNARAGKGREK